ncbi:MAG: hypothetical protein O2887_08275 [Bacteroidetes bacterium]|nr:hypothetical protein [Bacteroidota bacterium]MDA1120474.1 hypothetical protein [Bacteroidota bacterium]
MIKYLLMVVSFMPIVISAQNTNNVSEALSAFEENNTYQYQEKIYLHTDKSTYITGETLWFKAYLVNATTHTPSSLSKVLYVQLIDDAGQNLMQQRVQIGNEKAVGQIFISSYMPTGVHSLKAYTSLMRSNDDTLTFAKNITVINPSIPINTENHTARETKVEFFPEGGQLVNGLQCKIGVKAINGFGLGEALNLTIMDQHQNEVAAVATSSMGISSFVLIPEKEKIYYAQVDAAPLALKYALPVAKDDGVSLMVLDMGNDLLAKINATINQNVFVITHTRGIINEYKPVSIINGSVEVRLNKGHLGSGISHITILDENFSPIAERIIFKYTDSDLLKISIDQSGYVQREKVSMSIKMEAPVSSSLSASVYRNQNKITNSENIVTSLLLTSDIKGHVENPTYYFKGDLVEKSKELDNLLLTQGWRSFKWHDEESVNANAFIPEIRAPIVSGHLKGKGDLFYGFMGKVSLTKSIAVDSSGRFAFEVPFRLNNDKIIFWQNQDTLTSDQITVNEQFINWPASNVDSKPIDESHRMFFEHDNSNIQISHAYLDQTKVTGEHKKDSDVTFSFYGTPGKRYNLDDYTRFIGMPELFVEYIRTAIIKKTNQHHYLYVVGDEYPTTPALVLMDGVPVSADLILDLDPTKVETVDIVQKNYQLGERRFEGVINFITYDGDMAGADLPKGLVSEIYYALQTPRVFYQPDYGQDEHRHQRTPDFRNTLLWQPNITIENGSGAQVEFYTGDDTGNYKVEINGMTSDGQPLYAESEFSVNSLLKK